jgi:hypothetical protein
MVRSELFWQLQKKYSNLSIAERIAWEAAKNPLPGECEGYLECYISIIFLMEGEYLSLYPNGIHVDGAIDSVNEFIANAVGDGKESLTWPESEEERKQVLAQLAKLRTTIAKSSSSRKTVVLENIDKLINMVKTA